MNLPTPIAPTGNPESANVQTDVPTINIPAIDIPAAVATLPDRKRFTLEEYHRLIDMGFFGMGERVELICGDLVAMIAKNTAHVLCCQRLLKQLARCLGEEILQCQDPIILPSASEPEPDFAVLSAGSNGKTTADQVLLVIEIADSSLDYDRNIKGPLYAAAGIPHYWIFNLLDRQVECFSQPQQNLQGQNAGQWGYGLQQIVLPQGSIALTPPLQGTIDLTPCFPARESVDRDR